MILDFSIDTESATEVEKAIILMGLLQQALNPRQVPVPLPPAKPGRPRKTATATDPRQMDIETTTPTATTPAIPLPPVPVRPEDASSVTRALIARPEGLAKAAAILQQFGAKKASEVAPEKVAAYIAAVQKELTSTE